MAIYYSRLSLVSRSQGHSAVAAAAYRAGVRLHDVRTDQSHTYSKKRGVLDAAMLAPAAAPWAFDIKNVWNRAEAAEVRRNARTARELIVALPAELPQAEQLRLARQLGQDLVNRYGVAVLAATHAPDKKSDDRNVHVHLLMSTRIAGAEGFGAKVRILDDQKSGPKEAEAMRAGVAARINEALAAHGHCDRVDPRSLRKQSSDAARRGDFDAVVALTREPTRHQGREATAAARRGELSFVVASNDAVRRDNATLRTYGRARASHLKQELQRRAGRQQSAMRTLLPRSGSNRSYGSARRRYCSPSLEGCRRATKP
ncbi:MAG: MobA/MobL family protein [Dokdonella sp.]